jgi:putative salt-induced outer membrane protein
MSRTSLTAIVGAVALYATAHADTAAGGGWATRSELGFVMAHGNTDTKSGNLKFATAHVIGRWKYSYGLSALYAESSGIETAQRWDTHFQTDLALSERAFWFGAVRYEDDRFSGFAYQESLSGGAGRDFIRSDSTKFSAQLGVGIRRLRPELLVRDTNGAVIHRYPRDKTDDAVADAGLAFEHSFNTSTKVIDTLLIESGQNNTATKENLSLQVRMNASLALAVGLQVHNNSSPPAGTAKRTDTLTTINLVYELKNPNLTPGAATRLLPAAQAK